MRFPVRTTALTVGAGLYYKRLRTEKGRVERLAAAALESLLNAIDANDPQTGAHVRRVASYSLILADAYGVSERECRSIERVALFHDIGKIHEALFDITHDREMLSPAERVQVATHPQRGADVLAPLTAFYPDLGEGVLSHHERWDGTGYPRRLSGTAIPLAGRIVAIADTFDAITHVRRYRCPRTLREAADVIATERGKQLDPGLTDVFLSPAVLALVRRAMRELSTPVGPLQSQRPGKHADVPDVPFRWRTASVAAVQLDAPSEV